MNVSLLAGVALACVGAVTVLQVRRRVVVGAADYLTSLDEGPAEAPVFTAKLEEPFIRRIVRPMGADLMGRLVSLTPSGYLERVHQWLVLSGKSSTIRAEEFAAVQVLAAGVGVVLALLWVFLASPATRIGVLGLVAIPAMFTLAPQAWINRRIAERKEAIFKDLPDVLDLLAIAVEAGTGFDGALELVCSNFSSPLGEELRRTLKEMELGLSRREALANLKRRTEVRELSNFVLALTQADALGMPVGRVLHAQAGEMRLRRRQWAREKAGKLPVKILFPLVFFIFPAVMVVIMGPAASSIFKAFQ